MIWSILMYFQAILENREHVKLYYQYIPEYSIVSLLLNNLRSYVYPTTIFYIPAVRVLYIFATVPLLPIDLCRDSKLKAMR